MKDYFIKNRRIFLSIILSFLSVFFIIPFFMTPGKLTRTVGNFTKFWAGQDLSLLGNFFTLQFSNDNNQAQVSQQEIPGMNGINNGPPPVYVPPTEPIQPCTGQACLTPTATPTIGLINKTPTKKPIQSTPTVYIPPTKRPKPSPTPLAPPEYLRPGTGLDDIFKKAGELSCVPADLLKAFVANEAPGVLNWTDQQALFYNAYDWWHRVKTLKEVCTGYGWHPETGLVAEDSLFAGEKCKEPFSAATANDTYSQALGATQMLKSYWDKYYASPTKQKLKVSKVDRRVLIDSLIGFGVHLRQDSGYTGGCENWDLKYIAKAACVNTGVSCDVYNYCYTICNNYNKYSGKNNNCDGVKNYFVSGTCQFK